MTDRVVPYQSLEIVRITEPVPAFRLFQLIVGTGQPLTYRAGQYITLLQHGSYEEVRRSYSMSSSPDLDEPLTIGIRRLDNGAFSRWLFRMKEGHLLTTTGTGGFFTLPESVPPRAQLVFLAAGSGITPIFSIIKTALTRYSDLSIVLFYSNHSPEHTIFLQELIAWEKRFPVKFRIEFLFSNNHNLSRARLSPELLFQLLEEFRIEKSATFYMCGPEAYMRMCIFSLREAGVDDDRIRKESFIVRKPELSGVVPPDREQHEVVIAHNGRVSAVKVQYPVSILDAARHAGLNLPYSCQAGICGNCAAKCIRGSVWMSVNDVLTDKELAEGIVLTCTGYPTGGDVVLSVP